MSSRLPRLSTGVLAVVLLLTAVAHGQVSTGRNELLRQKKEIEAEVDKLLKSQKETDPAVISAISRYARVLVDLAEYKKALKWQRRLQKIERKTLPARDPGHIRRLLSLAECHMSLKKPKPATKVVRDAIAKTQEWWTGEERSNRLESIGLSCHGMSLYELSGDAYKECFDERTKRLGKDHISTLHAALGVAACMIETDQGDEAVPILRDTLARIEAHHPESGIRAILRNNLAAVHLQKEEFDEAKSALEPLWEEAQKSGQGGIRWTIRINYIAALEGLSENDKAIELAEAMIKDLEVNKRANKSTIKQMQETIDRCKKAADGSKTTVKSVSLRTSATLGGSSAFLPTRAAT